MDSLFPEEEMRPVKKRALPVVRFSLSETEIVVEPGTLLIEAARSAGLDVPQQCGGAAICGWCRMRIGEGAENLSAMQSEEERLIEWGKLRGGERASCQAEIHGDVAVQF